MQYQVSLEKIIAEFNLAPVHLPCPADEIFLTSADVIRPGLQLAGFYEVYDKARVQVLGKSEMVFMESFDKPTAAAKYEEFFSSRPPVVIICRGIAPPDSMLASATRHRVPLLTSEENTSALMAGLIATLNVELAPRVTRHGVLVEVYGEGILLLGDSGLGKSETAVELITRGHRLVADDAVELRRVSGKTLVGTSPENIRHFVELRGIGIINARRLFGMGSVKLTEKVDLIISFEEWNPQKVYDRLGMEDRYTEILGINIPSLAIPVTPGRNLAVIVEIAAMNSRQKKMGYNGAKELLQRLGMPEGGPEVDWENF